MALPQKNYFFLPDVAERWGATVSDLAAYAHEGQLDLCAMAINVPVETYVEIESASGSRELKTTGTAILNGPQFLFSAQVWAILQNRLDVIDHFRIKEPLGLARFIEGAPALRLSLHQLLITRQERDRFENAYALDIRGAEPHVKKEVFTHNHDYSDVVLSGERFCLGPAQASVIRELHAATLRGETWLNHQDLVQRCSRCTRLVDLFKSKPNWRKLIVFDKRGSCRLNVAEQQPPANRQRAFRRAMWSRNAKQRSEAVDKVGKFRDAVPDQLAKQFWARQNEGCVMEAKNCAAVLDRIRA